MRLALLNVVILGYDNQRKKSGGLLILRRMPALDMVAIQESHRPQATTFTTQTFATQASSCS